MYQIQHSGIIVPWATIAPYVERFNAGRDLQQKYAILNQLVGLIENLKKCLGQEILRADLVKGSTTVGTEKVSWWRSLWNALTK